MSSTFKTLAIVTFIDIFIIIEILLVNFYPVNKKPQEFEYKHHDYIYFPGKGIIHSPECHRCTLTFETI